MGEAGSPPAGSCGGLQSKKVNHVSSSWSLFVPVPLQLGRLLGLHLGAVSVCVHKQCFDRIGLVHVHLSEESIRYQFNATPLTTRPTWPNPSHDYDLIVFQEEKDMKAVIAKDVTFHSGVKCRCNLRIYCVSIITLARSYTLPDCSLYGWDQ